MFDAKSLLEGLMKGTGGEAAQRKGGDAQAGGLGDLLGQLGGMLNQQGGSQRASGGQAGGGLGDILGQLAGSLGQQRPGSANAPDAGSGGGLDDLVRNLGSASPAAPGTDKQGGGGLADILGQLQSQLGGKGGGLIDVLGQVLGQATAGMKEGAQRIDDATGASKHARDAIGSATGKSPDDILAQLKDLIQNNQAAAGAAAGGLGAVLLGTKAGRALTANAVKLGGLALIGGLAYKALQNYQQGKPLITGSQSLSLAAAPAGSGYETAAVSNDDALLYIRGMIAAAAADGRIDEQEQKKLLGGLNQAGLGAQAEEFLAGELNNPATVQELADAVRTQEQAVQLFTAARIAVDLDTAQEHDFLVALANALGLDGDLVAHIDAAARAAA